MHLDFIHGSLTASEYNMNTNRLLFAVNLFLSCPGRFLSALIFYLNSRIRKTGTLLFVTAMLVLVSACKKSVLDNDSFLKSNRKYEIAVEGGINTLMPSQYIRLTVPSINADSVPQPLTKASVVVNDGKADIIFKETSPGLYMGTNKKDPNYNTAYTLTIKYNSKIYTAVDTLRQVVNIVDDFLPISTTVLSDNSVRGVIPKHTFGYLNPNKWYIAYGDISLWDPSKFDQAKYYSYTHFLGSPNSLYPLNSLKREFTLEKDKYIYIYKISVSEDYEKYLYAIFMETDWNGLFSGVPVNVEGNVSGNAQGYFAVSDIDLRKYKASDL